MAPSTMNHYKSLNNWFVVGQDKVQNVLRMSLSTSGFSHHLLNTMFLE